MLLWHGHPVIKQGRISHAHTNVVQADSLALESDILTALRRIIDPDLGKDVVDCGFVRDLRIDHKTGAVDFTLRLTTPACPVKDDFRKKAEQYVGEIGWVKQVGFQLALA